MSFVKRIRWWAWIPITMVMLMSALLLGALLCRALGERALTATLSELRSKGHVVEVADLVAVAPVVDQARQRAWTAWTATFSDASDPQAATQHVLPMWTDEGFHTTPVEVTTALAIADPIMASGRRLLREGPVVAGMGGHLFELTSVTEPVDAQVRNLGHTLSDNLMMTRACASTLRLEACRDGGGEALDDLDRLLAAVSANPVTIIDTMIVGVVVDIRDDTYLRLAVTGHIPRQRAVPWMEESVKGLSLMADGFRGELCLWIMPWTRAQPLSMAWYVNHHAALNARWNTAWQERLRGTPIPVADLDRMQAGGGFLFRGVGFNNSVISMAKREASQRYARIAARLAVDCEAGLALPADAAGLAIRLGSDCLAGSLNHIALRYEPIDARTFRIGIDEHATQPDFVTPRELASGVPWGTPAVMEGKPPVVRLVSRSTRDMGIQVRVP